MLLNDVVFQCSAFDLREAIGKPIRRGSQVSNAADTDSDKSHPTDPPGLRLQVQVPASLVS